MSVFSTMNFSWTHLYPGNCYLESMDFKRSLCTRLSSLSHLFYVSPISLTFLLFFSFFFKYLSLKARSSVTLTSLHHWSSTLKYTLNILWLIPYKSIPYTHTTSRAYNINIPYLLGLTIYNTKGYIQQQGWSPLSLRPDRTRNPPGSLPLPAWRTSTHGKSSPFC